MKSNMKKTAKICLFVSAVLCLALILVQFLPYWTAPGDPNYKPSTAESTTATTKATEATAEATADATGDATGDATDAPTETSKKKNPLAMLQTFTPPEVVLEPETDPISIFSFLVLNEDHPYIARYLGAETEANPEVINSLAGTFCIVMLLGFVAIVFVFLKSDKLWISVWPVVVGVGSLFGYLTQPVWAKGSLHIVLIAISAALTVAALIPFAIWLYSFKFWFMDPKKLEQK